MSNSNQQRPYEEENYPISPEIIYYAPNYFPIPDNYTIKTTWGRANNSCTIQCSIYYVEKKPHYLICFGDNLQYQVFQLNHHLMLLLNYTKRTAVSGVHLFGLQLKCINRNHKGRPRELKLHKESSKTTQIKRAKGLAKKEQVHFENTIKDFYNPKDRVFLKALDFTVENKEYHVKFGNENYVKKKQKLQSIAYVQDKLNSTIVQEGPSEKPYITDPLIIEQVINATGKDAYRSVKKILEYIIPSYVEKGILDPAIPTIYLRISGSENYPTLKVAANALTQELQELSNSDDILDNILHTEGSSQKTSPLWNYSSNTTIERHLLNKHNIIIPKVRKQTTLNFKCTDPWPAKEKFERDKAVVIWIRLDQIDNLFNIITRFKNREA
ncbi:hypothetical protein GLOIN_2v1777166 [Rhizophagus irregularis DAOM 181602=DAOM 197198]|uniref:Uncharacterized protein n=1 Tax=Rhizophagus irregularis (strain DAOM 181602 / DAOM 197198 / MUCL 43194) TaxID=747089 RepID=A0A2P4PVF6_RHIID|nr:hypothetical protein GLOIN_2v1777166 [Rhizophagus irregularis DAOM 181602=DAOM 197198]POG69340.1 hypothetical protein GLOIN_2v1777166 [Rhizophagus irregularis DAOM 181602=DAOM 197198]|eukprot:XP_025176206.1 hypothetical protein GLOIN_2v1777166 [Rhizophagus irregularis DAOM 181602=DAOM 197198]